MISTEDQKNLFIEIGNRLPRQVTVYAVGGTAMMFLGFKEATLDIDLVFTEKDDRKLFKKIASSLGYKEMDSVIVYGIKNNRPEMIHLGDARLDLFLNEVISFTFSKTMQQRALETHQFGKNLMIKIADRHDIILMKCATSRIKDEDDIVRIVKSSDINWSILVEEAKIQVSLGRETAYLEMGSLLEKLAGKHNLPVPKQIYDTFFDLLEKQMKAKEKTFKKN